ncbi:MAG: DMT family transporter [Vulcanimicrobiaceae bacterium]
MNVRGGVLLGMVGMVAFSATFPATKLALTGFDPFVVTAGRIVIAGTLGAALLIISRATTPSWRDLVVLAVAGAGLAIGYPWFVALGLATASSVHGAVVAGFSPSATAALAVIRNHERPPAVFWVGCIGALVAVTAYVVASGGGFGVADLYFVAAVLSSSIAYVEGSRLSHRLGADKTLSWALVLMVPIVIVPLILDLIKSPPHDVPLVAWGGFAWVSLISMFLGAMAWYRGMQLGGTARISQLLVLQPLVTIGISRLIVREPVTLRDLVYALVVIVCVAIAIRSRTPQT